MGGDRASAEGLRPMFMLTVTLIPTLTVTLIRILILTLVLRLVLILTSDAHTDSDRI